MPKFCDMSDKVLEEALECCFRYMASLIVNSQVPAENRREYRQYQQTVAAIEAEQDSRYVPTVADQDTTHYIW